MSGQAGPRTLWVSGAVARLGHPDHVPLLLTPRGLLPLRGGEVVFSLKVTLGNVIWSLCLPCCPAGLDTTLCPGKHPAQPFRSVWALGAESHLQPVTVWKMWQQP